MKQLLVILIYVSIIALVCFITLKFIRRTTNENFFATDYKVNTVKTKLPILNISMERNNIYLRSLSALSENNPYVKVNAQQSQSTLQCTDAFTYQSLKAIDTKVLTILSIPKVCLFFVLSSNIQNVLEVTTAQIYEITQLKGRKLKCGYVGSTDVELIEKLLYCQTTPIVAELDYIKLMSPEQAQESLEKNAIDIYFYFNTMEHPNFNNFLDSSFTIINQSEVDNGKLLFEVPYIRIKNLTLYNPLLPNYSQFTIATPLVDTLLYTLSNTQPLYYDVVLDNVGDAVRNNFYLQFFEFYEHSTFNSLDWSKTTSNAQFEEGFSSQTPSDTSITILISSKVQLFPVSHHGDFISYSLEITNVKELVDIDIKVGDSLLISNQLQTIYNDLFFVIGNSPSLIVSKYIFFETDIKDTDIVKTDTNAYVVITNVAPYPTKIGHKIYIRALGRTGSLGMDKNDQLICVLDEQEDTRFTALYTCYEKPDILNKSLCESTNNIDGSAKMAYTWDKVCQKDTECPFFTANSRYPNNRGGCLNGYCEFPLGIERISYRKFNPTSKPLCYSCDKDKFGTCCSEQEQPDYAFEHDSDERRINNMTTI